MSHRPGLLAGIETGGTKIVCVVGVLDDPGAVVDRVVVPTETPETAAPQVRRFLARHHEEQGIAAAGIASFGPLDIDPGSGTYGQLLNTPKIAWRGFDVHEFLQDLGEAPSAIVTDVDGSLLGERYAGAAADIENAAYITVGTGIGVSLMAAGHPVHGYRHAELGHVVPRRAAGDDFAGVCPYHGDCLEGLASGPAIQKRQQTQSDEQWEVYCADYIGQLCSTLALTGIPERIIVGGGVSQREGFLAAIFQSMVDHLADYLVPAAYSGSDAAAPAVVPPGLGGDAGAIGALSLARSLIVT